jgi:hypothetical protein
VAESVYPGPLLAYGASLADVESAVLNIFDLMGTGQSGAGMDAVARQFGLSQEQAQRAFAALMPAFMLGLQRNAVTPNAFANLMSMMGPGPFTGSQAQSQGNEALGRLFGPPELTRQIAEQAAHWSGVSAQVLQQMMPILAAAVVGSLSNFSEAMRAHAAAGAATPDSGAAAAPYAAWAEMMRSFFNAASPAPQPSPAKPDAGEAANPWADMLRMMGGQPSGPTEPEPPPEPKPEALQPSSEAMQAAWSQALESGREAQAHYLASLQNIFDQFWGAGPGRR